MVKKKNKAKQTLSFITIMLVCLVVGYFAGKLGVSVSHGFSKLSLVAEALLFIPTFLFVIGVHEAGHAVAGVWMNFDFRMYVIGPFMWEKEQNTWKFKWNTNVNTSGGMVICLPVGTEDLPKRFSIYAAGGPVASIVLAGFSYGIYLLISSLGIVNTVGIQTLILFLLVMSFLSFVIFFVTAIPLHLGGFYSDGGRVLRLLSGGEKARFEVLILKIITTSTSGIRPKLLNIEDLVEARLLTEKLIAPFGIYILSYLYQAAFDNGSFDEAEEHLLNYIKESDQIPHGIRNSVWVDSAFFYAYAKNDLVEAEKYWKQFKHSAIVPKAQILATEAAISFLKNEKELALSKIEASIKEIPNMIDKGVGLALCKKLEIMKSQIGNKISTDINYSFPIE